MNHDDPFEEAKTEFSGNPRATRGRSKSIREGSEGEGGSSEVESRGDRLSILWKVAKAQKKRGHRKKPALRSMRRVWEPGGALTRRGEPAAAES